MDEDQILTQIVVDAKLAELPLAHREMICLIYRLHPQPDDWDLGRWPPTYEDVGTYIGRKFEGKALSEAAIRYRRDAILEMWRGERGELRRVRHKIVLLKEES
jgi:hypothetical protein